MNEKQRDAKKKEVIFENDFKKKDFKKSKKEIQELETIDRCVESSRKALRYCILGEPTD